MCSELIEKSQHTFTWTIENFRACKQKNGSFLESSAFVAESLDKTTWSVRLYPKGDEDILEFISVFLKRSSNCTGPDEIECTYCFEAIDENGKVLKEVQYKDTFQKGEVMGSDKFVERHLLDENIYPFNTLTIQVTMEKTLPIILTKNSCHTKITTDEFSFKCKIMTSTSSCAQYKSVCFSNDLQFELAIRIPQDDIEIGFSRVNGFRNSELLLCTVALLDSKGKETVSKEAVFEADHPYGQDSWKFPTFLKKSQITADKGYDDYFTLKFDFALSVGKTLDSLKNTECRSLEEILRIKENLSVSLKTDLERVFADRVHTDVELHVDDQVIHAHKVILCARSPVFLVMFHQDMVENQTGVINISDVEIETLKSLLEFMYTGDTQVLDCQSALKLLLAADKYQVSSLKEKCSSSLELFLSDENVCNILFTADLIQQETLKACAMDYIKQKPKKIFQSASWKEMLNKNPKLASEIICQVSTF